MFTSVSVSSTMIDGTLKKQVYARLTPFCFILLQACVYILVNGITIGSGNGLIPNRCQAIT